MTNDAGKAHLETYLTQVQRYLHGLPDPEAREVIAELRSHVLDKVDGAPTPQRVEAAIAELGSPGPSRGSTSPSAWSPTSRPTARRSACSGA
jgi:hypothetical protein